MKNNLICDVFSFGSLKRIDEGRHKNRYVMTGLFQEAEKFNKNKRRYPRQLLQREIEKLQENIRSRRLTGELDHPQSDIVQLSNASHLITDLKMEGNQVYGTIEILSTPKGQIVRSLIDDGVDIGISSRALGSLINVDEGTEVQDDLNMITWDIVADPSTYGAFPSVNESYRINESVQQKLNEAKKIANEKIYFSVLKAYLRNK